MHLRGKTERRRSPRFTTQNLRLAYFNGATAVSRVVREMSLHGAFIETADRWYPGVLMYTQLLFDMPAGSSGNGKGSRELPSETGSVPLKVKIIRCVPEGICIEFIFEDRKEEKAVSAILSRVLERGMTSGASAGRD